jgi:hypothetical protein
MEGASMGRFHPKTFAQPDLLKSIQPQNLIRLLEPCRDLLESHGLSLPREGGPEVDYLDINGVLASPTEWMDSHVVEGLHVIGSLGTNENFDELLDIARRNSIDAGMDATAADLAARIWIEAPQALEMKQGETASQGSRKFESFRAREPQNVLPGQLPIEFSALETELEAWFVAEQRGVGCRVIRIDLPSEVQFMVQHGQMWKREPSRRGLQSACASFRPERTDLVIYDVRNSELRISAGPIGQMRLYREMFGKHIFGDPEMFVYARKYTLTPLQTLGSAALYSRDVTGVEWVRLTEIEYAWSSTLEYTERHTAEDVFMAMELTRRGIETEAQLQHACFAVKLAGETYPWPLVIQPPNVAEYGRGEEAAVIEQWLRARGFVLTGSAVDDEDSSPFMAVA